MLPRHNFGQEYQLYPEKTPGADYKKNIYIYLLFSSLLLRQLSPDLLSRCKGSIIITLIGGSLVAVNKRDLEASH